MVSQGLHIFGLNLDGPKETIVIVGLFLLVVLCLEIILHHSPKALFALIPESGVVILMGCILGSIFVAVDIAPRRSLTLDPEIFFLILIPPIIFEAGYSLKKTPFRKNLVIILVYALVGTFLSAIILGTSALSRSNPCVAGFLLWIVSPTFRVENQISFLEALVFGTVLSAVDPVAVIAIFDKVKVNRRLNAIVFGESVLNDAMSIVLFVIFTSLLSEGVTLYLPVFAVAKFLVVSLGGIFFGLAYGVLASFITKYSDVRHVVQPFIVVLCAYLSYITSEIFAVSGIVAILIYGIFSGYYAAYNISSRSRSTLSDFAKITSLMAEALVFAQLGISTAYHVLGPSDISSFTISGSSGVFRFGKRWDATMILFTLLFIFILRFLLIFLLTMMTTKLGEKPVSTREQIVVQFCWPFAC